MKTIVLTAGVLALLGACAASPRAATDGAATINAAAVPVSSVTKALSQPAPLTRGICHPDTGVSSPSEVYTVTFDIETDGSTSNVSMSDWPLRDRYAQNVSMGTVDIARQCALDIAYAVKRWRYEPPMLDGEPVRITGAKAQISLEPRQRL